MNNIFNINSINNINHHNNMNNVNININNYYINNNNNNNINPINNNININTIKNFGSKSFFFLTLRGCCMGPLFLFQYFIFLYLCKNTFNR